MTRSGSKGFLCAMTWSGSKGFVPPPPEPPDTCLNCGTCFEVNLELRLCQDCFVKYKEDPMSVLWMGNVLYEYNEYSIVVGVTDVQIKTQCPPRDGGHRAQPPLQFSVFVEMPPGGPESQASETGPGDTILRHPPADSSLSRYNTIGRGPFTLICVHEPHCAVASQTTSIVVWRLEKDIARIAVKMRKMLGTGKRAKTTFRSQFTSFQNSFPRATRCTQVTWRKRKSAAERQANPQEKSQPQVLGCSSLNLVPLWTATTTAWVWSMSIHLVWFRYLFGVAYATRSPWSMVAQKAKGQCTCLMAPATLENGSMASGRERVPTPPTMALNTLARG
eukprot:g39554.t1